MLSQKKNMTAAEQQVALFKRNFNEILHMFKNKAKTFKNFCILHMM